MTGSNAKAANVKLLKQALIGGVVGAGATTLLLSLIGDSIRFSDFGTVLAVIAGVTYTLLGLVVGSGVLAPRAGARFLNVADADEIREDKRKLGPSAAPAFQSGYSSSRWPWLRPLRAGLRSCLLWRFAPPA